MLHVRATMGLTKKLIHRPVCQVDSDFNPPSCTLREQCLQFLVVSDLQEQSVQRAANRPPETPAWRKIAQASGPRHKMFLRGSQIMSSCVDNAHKTTMCRIFQSKMLLVYSIWFNLEVHFKLWLHLVAGFHQVVSPWAGCSCISSSPFVPLSPSWL